MTEKRFVTNGYAIYDTYHDGKEWLVNNVDAGEIVGMMNNLDIKARERSKALSKLQKENDSLKQELFESEVDYFLDTYQDNPIRAEQHIDELKEEFKERFGRDFE